MRNFRFFLSLWAVLTAGTVWADVPRTINYQGYLTDLNGIAAVDGTHALTISLYSSATATLPDWTDLFSAVTKNGYFNIVLGSNPQKALNTLDFSKQYWVGIRVDTDSEMTPRQALSSVPYALNALPQNLPGYLLSNIRYLHTGTGTYIPPAGVRALLVECVGPGGGGGGTAIIASTSCVSAGGSAGGYTRKWITPVGTSYPYVVGAGGAGGAAAGFPSGNGVPGSANTTFDTMIAGFGLQGLQGGPYPGPGIANSFPGGAASGGDINCPGALGSPGILVSLNFGLGGAGGNSIYGGGGSPNNDTGGNGNGYGSGGGGNVSFSGGTNYPGGKGADGIISIWEYK
jgi:hypothetical protein